MSLKSNNDIDSSRKLSSNADQNNSSNKIAVINVDPVKTPQTEIEQTNVNESIPPFSIGKIYKNLLFLSLAFILMFTAYNGMVTLQSSLNVKGNVGVNSLIITYSFLIVSSTNGENENNVQFYSSVPLLLLEYSWIYSV